MDGVQEVNRTLKSGCPTDVTVVETWNHVRLSFARREGLVGSETVILGDFGKSVFLPDGQTVPIEFTPDKPGEYDSRCQMNMLRGKLVVE